MSSTDEKACMALLETFFACCGVTHQQGYVYRNSEFDNCNLQFSNFKNCVMAKATTDEEKKKVRKYTSIVAVLFVINHFHLI